MHCSWPVSTTTQSTRARPSTAMLMDCLGFHFSRQRGSRQKWIRRRCSTQPRLRTSEAVARETRRDPILARVYESIVKGWSVRIDGDKPYYERRNELTVHQGCILWGIRVVISNKLQDRVLEELHDSHLGVVKMKALARSYVWWPNISGQLEELAKGCDGCQLNQRMPTKAPLHPWEWATAPWQRLHIDFASPFQNSMFLVVVDAHSKWPEVIPLSSTTTSKTIEVLRDLFARFGIPEQIVSDNGP